MIIDRTKLIVEISESMKINVGACTLREYSDTTDSTQVILR